MTILTLDWQICPLDLESYGYKTSDIVFEWHQILPSIEIKQGLKLPNYRMRGHLLENCTKVYETGNFTCISGM